MGDSAKKLSGFLVRMFGSRNERIICSMLETVEEINLEANTFKLKGPEGVIEEYAAMNPENLKRAAVGDLVIITMTEAVAISVEAGPAE